MIVKVCGPKEGFLNEMHGRRACDPKPLSHCNAILPNTPFPPEKTLVSRFQGKIPKDVRQDAIIFRPLDGRFLNPCNGGPGLFHLFGGSVPYTHHTHGGMIFNMGHLLLAIVLIFYSDIHIRGKFKIIWKLFQAIEPNSPMIDVFGVFGLKIFRDHLMQCPSFPAMNLLHGQAFVFLRQCIRQDMGVMP